MPIPKRPWTARPCKFKGDRIIELVDVYDANGEQIVDLMVMEPAIAEHIVMCVNRVPDSDTGLCTTCGVNPVHTEMGQGVCMNCAVAITNGIKVARKK